MSDKDERQNADVAKTLGLDRLSGRTGQGRRWLLAALVAVSIAGALLFLLPGEAVIHSSIDGIVLVRNVEPGQTVAATFQAPVLFTLAEDLTKMELHVDVEGVKVGRLSRNQRALLRRNYLGFVLAFLFSAAVGVVFGYFPARKAARLDPIDALRHE